LTVSAKRTKDLAPSVRDVSRPTEHEAGPVEDPDAPGAAANPPRATRRFIIALLLVITAVLSVSPSVSAAQRATPKGPTIVVATADKYAEKGATKLNEGYLAIPSHESLPNGKSSEITKEIGSIAPCRPRGKKSGQVFECQMTFTDTYLDYQNGEFVEEEQSTSKGDLLVGIVPRGPKQPGTVTFTIAGGYQVVVYYLVR
jgi:hypothetical protein